MDFDRMTLLNRIKDLSAEVEELKAGHECKCDNTVGYICERCAWAEVERLKIEKANEIAANERQQAVLNTLREGLEPFANETAFIVLSAKSCGVNVKDLERAREALKRSNK